MWSQEDMFSATYLPQGLGPACQRFFSRLWLLLLLLLSLVFLLLLLKKKEDCLYVLELTIGFETNLNCHADRKRSKYAPLVSDLKCRYKSATFVNLSISSLGIFGNSYHSFLEICDSLSIDEQHTRYFISKFSTISIQTAYCIFCCRSKPWTNPDLLPF